MSRKKQNCSCPGRSTAFAVGLLGCTLVVAGLMAPAPAVAQSGGNLCVKEKIGGNPPCTANDVRVGKITLISGEETCEPGTLYTGTFEAVIESGPDRYDIGLWVNESGGEAKTDPDGTCYRDYLPPPLEATACDQQGGPYFNGEVSEIGDICGDVYAQNTNPCGNAVTAPCTGGSGGTCLFTTRTFTATITCADSNDDGKADVGTCTSWDNQVDNNCTSALETDPGTGSKCNCGTTEIVGLFTGCKTADDCNDGNECTDDVCTIEGNVGTCTNPPVADSTPCEDGDFCTSETGTPQTPDHCFDGICTGVPVSCPGDQCNVGVCDVNTGACGLAPVENSTPCEDGLFCTSFGGVPGDADHCFDGTCTGEPVDCGPGDDCNDNVCNEDSDACGFVPVDNSTPCEDGLFCTSFGGVPGDADHCFDGTCTGEPVDCGPGDDCNTNECNEASDACEFVPVANSTPCEDGLFCTSFGGVPGDADHCFDGTCTGEPVDCGPGDDCNTNECNEASDACEFVPVENSTPCQDGLYCTSFGGVPGDADHCFDGTCTGEPVDCGPGDDCNTNECNEASDACEFVPVENSTPCQDGLYCTSFGGVPGDADHCFDGTCTGEPVDCGDGDDCNTNECNEDSDACEFVPVENSTPCEDGLYCTSFGGVPGDADHCFDGTCTGEPVDCGDGDDCNTNECNEDSDACEFVPVENSTPCEDGLFCTSFGGVPGDADHCFDGTCTGEPADCNDDVGCTDDFCDEVNDRCDNAPIDANCDDGALCTGIEFCDPTGDCQPGADICVDACVSSGNARPKPPSTLEWQYINTGGDSDFDSACITVFHPRDGDLFTDLMVDDGDFFITTRQGQGGNKKLNPRLDFTICAKVGGTCTMTCDVFSVHTSCSQPLDIGDRFSADGEPEVELSGQID